MEKNNHSNGNNYSYGNSHSKGNNHSDGNNHSKGNNCSNGNNYSYGNNCSDGNNCSKGNNYSNGNNCSNGNNYSLFLHNCNGTHCSTLCSSKNGIAFMVLNQKLEENQAKEFQHELRVIIKNWLPYTTNYSSLKAIGWHKLSKDSNEYVDEVYENEGILHIKQYHNAWKSCPCSLEIIELIRGKSYLDTDKALSVFTEITGIETNDIGETIEIEGKQYTLKEIKEALGSKVQE